MKITSYKDKDGKTLYKFNIYLGKAKKQVGHGNWIPWIEGNLGYSRKTASNLIRVYESYPNGNTSSHLNFSKVLALTSITDENFEKVND